jgi:excisionase family DNA binding protein
VTQTAPIAPVAVRVDTAARMLDTAPSTVILWIKTGKLPAKKIGRVWLVRVEDIKALAEPTLAVPR